MRNKIVKSDLVVLLVLVFCSFLVTSCSKSGGTSGNYERSTIEFRQDNQVKATITFDKDEMKKIDDEIQMGNSKATAEYINEKLAESGVKCCEPRKRLDDCTWQCCDRSLVKIPDCNPQLRIAVEKSLGP